jgi:hypothetical protein
VTVLVALAGLVLTALEWNSLATSDAVGDIGAEAGSIAYAALGALIVRRAGNLVGWFMLAEGAASAVMTTGSAYAILGVKAHPGMLPGAGFPAAAARHGSGLRGMSDRLAAHGGTLAVTSRPGQGTTITGRLPISERTNAAGLCPANPG